MNKSEIRQNKATKQWVIYAPSRRKRPKEFRLSRYRIPIVNYEKRCPFCPGNEKRIPSIIMEIPNYEKTSWQTRIIPNKYPALIPYGDTNRNIQGIYMFMHGYGRHEIIIESPYHNQQIHNMSRENVRIIIETYHKRYVDLMKEHNNMMILIFQNHGVLAGTSLRHPHSQIIVTGIVPKHIRWREEIAQRHFDDWGKCVYCTILEFEEKDGGRVIEENDSFLAFVPYAAEVPFEIMIMPRRHNADFGSISDQEKEDLLSAAGLKPAR